MIMKMQTKVLKTLVLLLIAAIFLPTISACSDDDNYSDATPLSFKDASGYDYLKRLDGTLVTISGYMATSSPVDGSFIFLMNLPYQSCPFCVPNTQELSNTMEIYPKSGESFSYTAQAIKVVGRLEVAKNKGEPFTDRYGYEFNFKIVDATYTIIKTEDLSEDVALWQRIADSDVVNDIYKMYDYVNFLCAWNTYFINSYVDENGDTHPGYFLYPTDAEKFIYKDGAQYNYGYKEGYFDSIINKIESVDKTAFSDLVDNVKRAKALSEKALSELQNENYTAEYQYVEKFGNHDYVYTLNKGEELKAEMNEIYSEFSDWLGSWEM